MEIVPLARRGELTADTVAILALWASCGGVALVAFVVEGVTPPRVGCVRYEDSGPGGLLWMTFLRSACSFIVAHQLGNHAHDRAARAAWLNMIVASVHSVVAIVALQRALGPFVAYAFAASLIIWPIWLLRDCERWREGAPIPVDTPSNLPVARLRS